MQEGQDIGQAGKGLLQEEDFAENVIPKVQDAAGSLGIGTEKQRDQFFGTVEKRFAQSEILPETGIGRDIAVLNTGSEVVRSGFEVEEAQDFAKTVSPITQSEEQINREENIISGIGTFGSNLVGLGISTPPSVTRSLEQDTPGLGEGVVKGAQITSQDLAENPGEFVAQELGEEIGETIVTTAVLGPAGIGLSAVPTPEFTPNVNVDVSGSVRNVASQAREKASNFDLPDPTQTRKGQAGISTDSSTPSFVQDQRTGPETVEVDPVIQQDLIPEFSQRTINQDTTPGLDQSITQSTFNGQTLLGTTSTTGATARPDTVTQAEPGINEVTGPNVREEFLPQTENSSLGLSRTTSDFLLEPDSRVETRAEPNLERTPSGDFGPSEQDSFFQDEFAQEQVDRGEGTGEFASSLTAGLFGIEAGEEFEEEEFVGTGFDIRPLVNDQN
jgi:hypothetical protein